MACLLAVLLGAWAGDPGRGARIEGDEGDVPFLHEPRSSTKRYVPW
jgi:hypothetical protein